MRVQLLVVLQVLRLHRRYFGISPLRVGGVEWGLQTTSFQLQQRCADSAVVPLRPMAAGSCRRSLGFNWQHRQARLGLLELPHLKRYQGVFDSRLGKLKRRRRLRRRARGFVRPVFAPDRATPWFLGMPYVSEFGAWGTKLRYPQAAWVSGLAASALLPGGVPSPRSRATVLGWCWAQQLGGGLLLGSQIAPSLRVWQRVAEPVTGVGLVRGLFEDFRAEISAQQWVDVEPDQPGLIRPRATPLLCLGGAADEPTVPVLLDFCHTSWQSLWEITAPTHAPAVRPAPGSARAAAELRRVLELCDTVAL